MAPQLIQDHYMRMITYRQQKQLDNCYNVRDLGKWNGDFQFFSHFVFSLSVVAALKRFHKTNTIADMQSQGQV